MREFDAPDVANYIDADTVDKITAARKPKALAGTIKKGPKPKDEQQSRKEVQEEHR